MSRRVRVTVDVGTRRWRRWHWNRFVDEFPIMGDGIAEEMIAQHAAVGYAMSWNVWASARRGRRVPMPTIEVVDA